MPLHPKSQPLKLSAPLVCLHAGAPSALGLPPLDHTPRKPTLTCLRRALTTHFSSAAADCVPGVETFEVDNLQLSGTNFASFEGLNWASSSTNGPFVGTNYRHSKGAEGASIIARFSFNALTQQNYEVFISWSTSNGHRAPAAPLQIEANSVITSTTVDQVGRENITPRRYQAMI